MYIYWVVNNGRSILKKCKMVLWPIRVRVLFELFYKLWFNFPRFKFYFLLLLGIVMYNNEFETKENKI